MTKPIAACSDLANRGAGNLAAADLCDARVRKNVLPAEATTSQHNPVGDEHFTISSILRWSSPGPNRSVLYGDPDTR